MNFVGPHDHVIPVKLVTEVKFGLLINIGRAHITGTFGIIVVVKTHTSCPYQHLQSGFPRPC